MCVCVFFLLCLPPGGIPLSGAYDLIRFSDYIFILFFPDSYYFSVFFSPFRGQGYRNLSYEHGLQCTAVAMS